MSHRAWLTGLVLALAPVTPVLGRVVAAGGAPGWLLYASAAALALGGLALERRARVGRVATTGAALAWALAVAPALADAPTVALVIALATLALLAALWDRDAATDRPASAPRRTAPAALEGAAHRVRAAAGVALAAALAALGPWPIPFAERLPPVATSVAVVAGCLAVWGRAAARTTPSAVRWVAGALVASLAGALVTARAEAAAAAIASLVLLPLVALAVVRPGRPATTPVAAGRDALFESPARSLVATFLALVVAGTALLVLPGAGRIEGLSLVDAFFTATSAACVTGLTVVDTAHDLSTAGQVAVLGLIQLGGLGMLTFGAAAFELFGRRLGMRHEGMLAALLAAGDRAQLRLTLRHIVVFTVGVECAGALALASVFVLDGEPLARALWRGLFTAVSAFCNAGFTLDSTNLVGFHERPVVLHVVAALVVLGGLSPLTVVVLPRWLGRRPVPVQAKLALVTTAVLLVAGTALFAALEWRHVLGGLAPIDRLHNAWFQSVTTRTAGFNTVDLAGARDATVTWMVAWMLVGGSPGGTAGGLKTTTVAVLFLAVVATLRGQPRATVFGRAIPHATVYRAASIVAAGVVAALVATFAIQLTQTLAPRVAVFEVVSALATVGLTLGGTAELDGLGKVLIALCMFAGRVGPLSLFLLLADRPARDPWRRPEEPVDVG